MAMVERLPDRDDEPATRGDLNELRAALRRENREFRIEMRRENREFRTEVRRENQELHTAIVVKPDKFQTELRAENEEPRTQLPGEMWGTSVFEAQFRSFRFELRAWMSGWLLALSGGLEAGVEWAKALFS